MYSDFTPKFVKKYANVGKVMADAFREYIEEVNNGSFPKEENSYKIDESVIEQLK